MPLDLMRVSVAYGAVLQLRNGFSKSDYLHLRKILEEEGLLGFAKCRFKQTYQLTRKLFI